MAWTTPYVFTTAEVVTAAQLNAIQANLTDLDRRTTLTGAEVAGAGTTTSTSYAIATTTAGPVVTTIVGANLKVLISIYGDLENDTATAASFMSYEITGATTQAPTDALSIAFTAPSAGGGIRMGAVHYGVLAVAGSTTVHEEVRVTSGTGTFRDRRMSLNPLSA